MQFGNSIAPQGWQQLSLEDICLKITSGGTPNRKNPDFYNNGEILWVKTKELNNYFIYDTEEKITKDALNKSSAKLLPKDTILLAMYGATVGELGILSKEMACNQACCALIINPKIADFRFVFYLLKLYKENIKGLATGAAQQNLSATTVKGFTFNFPPLVEQQEIADFLFGIDAKIQLNTQTNQTLEQIAQAIYKSWFVEYEPTRAKAAVLATGGSKAEAENAAMTAISGKTAAELAALKQHEPARYQQLADLAAAFPAALVPNDNFGEIPAGWEAATLGDITTSRREKIKNADATVLSAVASGELVKSEEYFSKQVYSKSIEKYLRAHQWDFAYNPSRINIGSIGLHEENYLGAVSPVYEVFSVIEGYHWFVLNLLKQEYTKNKIVALCSGSVRQTLKLKDFQSIECIIPPRSIITPFNRYWEYFRQHILANNEQSRILSEIRNSLLPKLLNGEI